MADLSVLFGMAACLVCLDCLGAVLFFCAVIWALLPPVLSLSLFLYLSAGLVAWGILGDIAIKVWCVPRPLRISVLLFYLVICLDPVHVLVLVFFLALV